MDNIVQFPIKDHSKEKDKLLYLAKDYENKCLFTKKSEEILAERKAGVVEAKQRYEDALNAFIIRFGVEAVPNILL